MVAWGWFCGADVVGHLPPQRLGECDLQGLSRPGTGLSRTTGARPHQGELVWQELSYSRTLDVLHNPRYAGAYVLGRTRQRQRGSGRRITRNVSREEWTVPPPPPIGQFRAARTPLAI